MANLDPNALRQCNRTKAQGSRLKNGWALGSRDLLLNEHGDDLADAIIIVVMGLVLRLGSRRE
ncbi:hypothetical protein CGRA01v4_00379 [Colletotrichum graminicola]|nr:hypothetical protein CGRA01v4_00379 [Colletotrichum graminicola]